MNEITVYRDFKALQFIRCLAPIADGRFATGAGFTLDTAMARCLSEQAEANYELTVLHPAGGRPVGIAAHPDPLEAQRSAELEAVETLALRTIHRDRVFRAFPVFRYSGIDFWATRTPLGYFALLRAQLDGRPFAVYSARRGLISTILKTWEEYRNVMLLHPSEAELRTYTKANRMFGWDGLSKLRFEAALRPRMTLDLSELRMNSVSVGQHRVVWLTDDADQQGGLQNETH